MARKRTLPPPYRGSAYSNPLPPPSPRKHKTLRGCLIGVAAFFLLGIIGVLLEDEDKKKANDARQTALMNRGDDEKEMSHDHTWTIDDVPMAHLQNASEYVSDPEHYLSREEKKKADEFLARLQTDCDVQSAYIVVGHVPNANTYRFAVDLGRKYGVGTAETGRGVTVVVAVEDRKWSIVTTREVQGELPDILANDIGTDYIVANMKKSDPSAAVMQSAEALYNLFSTGNIFVGENHGWTAKGLKLDSLMQAGLYVLDMDRMLSEHTRDSLNTMLSRYSSATGGLALCLLCRDMAGEALGMARSMSAEIKIDSLKAPSFIVAVKYAPNSNKQWGIYYNDPFADKVGKDLAVSIMENQLVENLRQERVDEAFSLALAGLTQKAQTNRITAFAEPTSLSKEEKKTASDDGISDLLYFLFVGLFFGGIILYAVGKGSNNHLYGSSSHGSSDDDDDDDYYSSSSSSSSSSSGGSYGGGGHYDGGGASGGW